MLNFRKRSYQKEILDDFDLKGNDLSRNLGELALVNRYLGGYKSLIRGVKIILNHTGEEKKGLRITDVGCGGGDCLRALADWAHHENRQIEFWGIDANKKALEYAVENSKDYPSLKFKCMDIFSSQFSDIQSDIVVFNLFLHHFKENEIIGFLKILKQNKCNILINDLHRNKVAYHLFRIVSRIFSFSYISRHDGKLSVRKSFTREDWQRMMKRAGIHNYRIHWQWTFRYLVICC